MLTQEQLKAEIHYDPDTGLFTRYIASKKTFKVAGSPDRRGYILINILCKKYLAHRLAFLYMTGDFPSDYVDHINGVVNDNSWANLRACTPSENAMNTRLYKNNSSGYKGVNWSKRDKKWAAHCRVNNKQHHIGYFETPEEAYKAYQAFAKVNHGEFYNSGMGGVNE